MRAAHIAAVIHAHHLVERDPWRVYHELVLGTDDETRANIRPDVLAFRVSWARPEVRIYEIKVDRGDLLRELESGKYRLYQKKCNRFYLATPKGLTKKEELPPDTGLVEVDHGLKFVVRAPIIKGELSHGDLWRVLFRLETPIGSWRAEAVTPEERSRRREIEAYARRDQWADSRRSKHKKGDLRAYERWLKGNRALVEEASRVLGEYHKLRAVWNGLQAAAGVTDHPMDDWQSLLTKVSGSSLAIGGPERIRRITRNLAQVVKELELLLDG